MIAIKQIVNKSNISKSDVVDLFVQIRKHLEKYNLKNTYNILNLYCNLLVHVIISKSNEADEMIIRINKHIKQNGHTTNLNSFTLELASCFNFEKLISEFELLLKKSTIIVEPQIRKTIFKHYIDSILESEITINRKPITIQELEKLSSESPVIYVNGKWVREPLYFHTYKFTRQVENNPGILYLECHALSTNQIRLLIPMQNYINQFTS